MSKENLSKGIASHRIHHIYPRDFVVDRKRHPKYHDFTAWKTYQKEIWKPPLYIFFQNPIKESFSKLIWFSTHRKCIKKYIKGVPIFHFKKLVRRKDVKMASTWYLPSKSHPRNSIERTSTFCLTKKFVERCTLKQRPIFPMEIISKKFVEVIWKSM